MGGVSLADIAVLLSGHEDGLPVTSSTSPPLASGPSAAVIEADGRAEPEALVIRFDPGARIDLWCASLGKWVAGFEAIEVDTSGWLVRRMSDGAALPDRFLMDDVRVSARAWR